MILDYHNATNIILEGLLKQFEHVVINNRINDSTSIGAVAELIPIDYTKDFISNFSKNLNLSDYALS